MDGERDRDMDGDRNRDRSITSNIAYSVFTLDSRVNHRNHCVNTARLSFPSFTLTSHFTSQIREWDMPS